MAAERKLRPAVVLQKVLSPARAARVEHPDSWHSPCMLVNAFLHASCPPVLALLLQPRMPPGDDIALSLPALWAPVPKLSPGKNFSFSGEEILCVN